MSANSLTTLVFYNSHIERFYPLVQGVLVFQGLFLLLLYFITKRKDVLHYSLFLLLSAAYFYLNAPFTFFGLEDEKVFSSALYINGNIPLIIITNTAYIFFLKYFFKDIYNNRVTDNLFRLILFLTPFLIAIFFLLRYISKETQPVFYISNFLAASVSLFYIVAIRRYKLRGSGWVTWGMFFNILGNAATILMIVLERHGIRNVITVGYPLLFMRVGILADMFFYQGAILKKWYVQEKQLAIEKMNAQLAIEKVRNKISMELHDDLGATLSGVAMYSTLIKTQIQSSDLTGAARSLDVVKDSSTQMIDRLSDMIWLLKTKQPSLEEFNEKLEDYASNMAAAKNMQVQITKNMQSDHSLTFEQRHNIYLFCKEAINNAVKYSEGSQLHFTISQTDKYITYIISDNGKGFDVSQATAGNGVKNMQQRAADVGADYSILSSPCKGCTVALRIGQVSL
ncbi:MAG TPA: 7TM diverse intracellular signaling domain-containing protein [Niabella sp.]|nr:7TM diverse intracellular signaling domain-containing protein [Niabella sp.]